MSENERFGDFVEAKKPHVVQGIPGGASARPRDDVQRLLDYVEGPFINRWSAIRKMNLNNIQVYTQHNLNALLIESNDFRMELDMWIPMAKRLYDEALATAQNIGHIAASELAQSGQGPRSNAQFTKDQAKAEVAPLKEVIDQMNATRESMVGMTFAAQTQLKTLTTDEGLENMAQSVDIPEEYFDAPVGQSLGRYARNNTARKD